VSRKDPSSPNLAPVLVPVCAGGAVAVVAAAIVFAGQARSSGTLAGIGAMLLASVVVERFPVPVPGDNIGYVSLSFLFGVSTIVLFGWAAGILVVCAAPAITQLFERRPPTRVAYNASAYAIAAAVAGGLIVPIGGTSATSILAKVAICASVEYAVNIAVISAVVSRSTQRSFLEVIYSCAQWTFAPFGLMASAALTLIVLWQRSPFLMIALVGPLIAIAMYQRSTYRALRAMRLALTDPLTGLGNHRHFHERLQRELTSAEEEGLQLSLCLVDVDDFKTVNDNFGHPAGDRVLAQVASRLRQGGEAFRLGGDEFAVLMLGYDEQTALAAAGAIVERIAALDIEYIGPVTVSAGIATFPMQTVRADELVRLADSALYWSKEHGKNRARTYQPDVVEIAALRRLADGPDRIARFRAAASLSQAVDARDAYTGSHSERVADLAVRIAGRLGLDLETIELTRIAARLHDLGKLAIPEDILRKAGPLLDAERLVLERHPQIGYHMLESLGVQPIAEWVLHHHERWDGSGYPFGLAGEDIPLGARIIFVADAYDAMTSDRTYRRRFSPEDAIAELERCAGAQFDPEVVSAFAAELGLVPDDARALA
jgi:diguanylate cyclase (GGDEF)-like protein